MDHYPHIIYYIDHYWIPSPQVYNFPIESTGRIKVTLHFGDVGPRRHPIDPADHQQHVQHLTSSQKGPLEIHESTDSTGKLQVLFQMPTIYRWFGLVLVMNSPTSSSLLAAAKLPDLLRQVLNISKVLQQLDSSQMHVVWVNQIVDQNTIVHQLLHCSWFLFNINLEAFIKNLKTYSLNYQYYNCGILHDSWDLMAIQQYQQIFT